MQRSMKDRIKNAKKLEREYRNRKAHEFSDLSKINTIIWDIEHNQFAASKRDYYLDFLLNNVENISDNKLKSKVLKIIDTLKNY